MNRRTFLASLPLVPPALSSSLRADKARPRELRADVVIVGGGTGGVAAAPAAAPGRAPRVRSVTVRDARGRRDLTLTAPYFLDATELGDLLPLTKTEYVTGAESGKETGEPHAAEAAQPANQQAFTFCFAVDYLAGEDHTT